MSSDAPSPIDPLDLLAERCRRELDGMDCFEGTLRRDACVRRHLAEAVKQEQQTLLELFAGWKAAWEKAVRESISHGLSTQNAAARVEQLENVLTLIEFRLKSAG